MQNKKKKISALLMASVITAGTVSSLSAGALAHFDDKAYMDSIFEDAFMVPPNSLFSCKNERYKNSRVYLVETEYDNVYDFYDITDQNADRISARITGNIDTDALDKALAEICPNAEYIRLTSISPTDDLWAFDIAGFDGRLPYDEARKKDLKYEQVCRIRDALDNAGDIQEFRYTIQTVFPCPTRSSLTSYLDERNGINNKELIRNYITENNLPCHIEDDRYDSEFTVVPDEKISIAEHYDLAEKIYIDLNISPYIIFLDMPYQINEATIDLCNNIKGDANDDGALTLSDTVTILQSIGNPDAYRLTPQGKFNADIAGDYDGITSKDALAVQMKLLGIE